MRRTFSIGLLLGSFMLAACHGSSGAPSPTGGGAPGGGTGSTVPGAGAPAPTAPDGGGSPGGGSAGGGSAGGAAAAPSAALAVADPAGGTGPFTLADLDRLVVSVDGANLIPGAHAVRVDVSSPAGTLYAQLRATLVASVDGTGRATAALQVRGSVIESFQDVGTWQLVGRIDGAPLAAASVELTE